jgi:hypothetical protein
MIKTWEIETLLKLIEPHRLILNTNGFPEDRYTRGISGSNSTFLFFPTRTPSRSRKLAPWHKTIAYNCRIDDLKKGITG